MVNIKIIYTPKYGHMKCIRIYIYIYTYPQESTKLYIIKMLEYIVHTQYKSLLAYSVSAKLNQLL